MLRTYLAVATGLLLFGCIGRPGMWMPDSGGDAAVETAGGDVVPDMSVTDTHEVSVPDVDSVAPEDAQPELPGPEIEFPDVPAELKDTAKPDEISATDLDIQGEIEVTDIHETEVFVDGAADLCVPDCEGKVCGEDGCGGVCGECPQQHVCTEFACLCVPDCEDTECGDDGCDGVCGECSGQDECVDGACVCQPACDGLNCGDDGCLGICGECGGQDECVDGVCVCQPACDGLECGDDGCGGSCGQCEGQDVCEEGTCVCQPACQDKNCGLDGCGGECGTCQANEECIDGVCQCIPECDGKLCGADGCGATCGACGQWEECHPTWFVCVALSVDIPEGAFWMGCNDSQDALVPDGCAELYEKPYHEVHLDSYSIDVTEVTAGQYAHCVAKNMCYPVTDADCWESTTNHGVAGLEEHPMNCVTWQRARTYCKWAGKDLCTEAQWEKAARGGCEKYPQGKCKSDSRSFPWGAFYNAGCDYTVHVGCQCDGGTCPVGQHLAGQSPYGVQNLGGNVTEWVRDWFADDYYCHGPDATPGGECGDDPAWAPLWSNPIGPDVGEKRSFRGAGFENELEYQFRLAFRNSIAETGSGANIGFRCCGYECLPNCDGKQCGDDGCGGVCGECSGQDACIEAHCVCQPACEGKACGDDGCGGSCGECTSQDPCQNAVCNAETGLCQTEPADNGAPCEDGMFCTDNDACDGAGVCIGGADTDCSEMDGQCGTAGCDEQADQCVVNQYEPDGTPCNADSNGCTIDDECGKGQCMAGNAAVCAQPPNPCEKAVCQSTGADKYQCVQEYVADGTPCVDDLFCTVDEHCNGKGGCVTTPNTCGMQAGQCVLIVCNELDDWCDLNPKPDGTSCNDGDVCTLVDKCAGGVCQGEQNVCNSRPLSTETMVAGDGSLAVGAASAHLGFGETVSVWRGGDWAVQGRFVDDNHSVSYRELELTSGWGMAADACTEGRAMTSPAVAAGQGGKFIVAVPHRYARVWKDPQNDTWCRRRLDWQLSFAGYDSTGNVLKSSTVLGPAENLWYGDMKKLGTVNPGECVCSHYPDDYSGWMGAGFPDHTTLPYDAVQAFSFPDGSYGVLRQVLAKPASDQPPAASAYYHTISASFEANAAGIALGNISRPRGCASLTADRIFVVYDDGAGDVGGLFIDQPGNAVSAPFDVTSVEPGHLTRPWCSALPDGRFVVVFSDCWEDGPCDVYTEVLEADGTLAGFSGSPHTPGGGAQSSTSPPAVTASGTTLVAWQDESGDADGFAAFGRFHSEDLEPLSAAFRFNDVQDGDQYLPWVVSLGTDFFALWADSQIEGTRAVFRVFDSDGFPLSGVPQRQADQESGQAPQRVRLVADDSNRVTLVWETTNHPAGSGTDIVMRNFTTEGYAAGGELMANQVVVKDQVRPDIARSPVDGRVAVIFEQPNGNDDPRITVRVFSDGDKPLTAEKQVDPNASGQQTHASIAAFDDGGFAVAYTTNHVPQYDEVVYLQFLDEAGDGTLGPYSMSKTKEGVRSSETDIVAGDGNPQMMYVTWSNYSMDWATSTGVYVRGFTGDGAGGTGEVLVTAEGDPRNPSVAYHSTAGVVVCWVAGAAVKCSRFDDQLVSLGTAFTLFDGGAPAHPFVRFVSDSGLWAVFQNNAPGDGDGYGIALFDVNLQGVSQSRPILVNMDSAGDQQHPAFAILPNGDKFIAWDSAPAANGGSEGAFYRILD